MIIYVALISVLNLGLGFALALYLGVGRRQMASTIGEPIEAHDHADSGVDD